ncbi:hypothetical protein [Pseudomonas sp. IzPS59]|uniref:hypothetical protein n=1 Tax=Pseudomonas sp. IzPS59 TaxID=2774459 RepID=UPI00178834D8|nr:hypothetical protein [Pseudomonas sp. IzPS59]
MATPTSTSYPKLTPQNVPLGEVVPGGKYWIKNSTGNFEQIILRKINLKNGTIEVVKTDQSALSFNSPTMDFYQEADPMTWVLYEQK